MSNSYKLSFHKIDDKEFIPQPIFPRGELYMELPYKFCPLLYRALKSSSLPIPNDLSFGDFLEDTHQQDYNQLSLSLNKVLQELNNSRKYKYLANKVFKLSIHNEELMSLINKIKFLKDVIDKYKDNLLIKAF